MPDLDTSVDELTDLILRTLDEHRYRPNRACMHALFLLRGRGFYPDREWRFGETVVTPVLELWDRADACCANPVGEWGSAYVPAEYAGAWGQREANELRWDARQLIRDYLTGLLGGDQ
jgi:hypothetical protein